MPSPDWERLEDFLQIDDFATTAQHRAGGNGPPRPIIGIFENPVDNARMSAGAGSRRRSEFEIDAPMPTFRCKESDVVGVRRGDTLTIEGKAWDVMATPSTDGAGWATVDLRAPVLT